MVAVHLVKDVLEMGQRILIDGDVLINVQQLFLHLSKTFE